MAQCARWLGGLLCVVLAAGCQGLAPAPAAAAPAERTIRDGVYTEMQSRYGASVFNGACARCHSTSEWRHESFLRSWSGRSVADLFFRIHDTMPRGAPASLSLQEYADVVAYILRLNGLPTGEAELRPDEAELQAIRIVTAPVP